MHPRTDAMVNGALVGIGTLGIVDNIVVHWLWQLHRAVPGAHALGVEITLVVASAGLVALGIWCERRARLAQPRI